MDVEQVVPGVWRAGTTYVNWYLVDGGAAGATIVDTGLPGYRDQLEAAVRETGHHPRDVAAVLLTHGHVDHVGGAESFGAPVHIHPADLPLARDPSRNRTDRNLAWYLPWPATSAFVIHALRNGATKGRTLEDPVTIADGDIVDVPGSPRILHTPGHTAGSCVFEFPEHGVAVLGDVLSTVSPFSGRTVDPELQTRGSSNDCDEASGSLDRLRELDVPVLLPGHGPPWRGGVEAALSSAQRVGCR